MIEPKLKLLDWQKGYIEDESRFCWLVASRQSGKSFAIALRRVLRALKGTRLGVLLSRGERQSVELMEKVKMHCQLLGAVMEDETTFFQDTSLLQHTAKFPSGARIIALPANPDTARGFSADVELDEFALHKDSKAIWASLAPVATRGYSIGMSSTFKGTENEFYRIGKDLNLHEGVRPARQPVKAKGWSGHWVDIHMVREQGTAIDIEALEEAIGDDAIWQEEFLNIPMSAWECYIPLELVLACESAEASLNWDGEARPGLCAGWDFARNRDRSVIVLGEAVADLVVVRGMIWLDRLTFKQQEKAGTEVAEVIQAGGGTFAMDAGGNGAQIAETLQKKFTCVDAVQFAGRVETGAKEADGERIKELVKVRIARDAKRRFENRTFRLPDSLKLRRAVAAVKRSLSPTGQIVIDAARTELGGHADEFWALALLNAAATANGRYVAASEGGTVGDAITSGLMEAVF